MIRAFYFFILSLATFNFANAKTIVDKKKIFSYTDTDFALTNADYLSNQEGSMATFIDKDGIFRRIEAFSLKSTLGAIVGTDTPKGLIGISLMLEKVLKAEYPGTYFTYHNMETMSDGEPAFFSLIWIPGGGQRLNLKTAKASDTNRGTLIFLRKGYVVVLSYAEEDIDHSDIELLSKKYSEKLIEMRNNLEIL